MEMTLKSSIIFIGKTFYNKYTLIFRAFIIKTIYIYIYIYIYINRCTHIKDIKTTLILGRVGILRAIDSLVFFTYVCYYKKLNLITFS